MLQEKLYPGWARWPRKWWNMAGGWNRIVLFWILVLGMSAVVISVISTDVISWDKLNHDFLPTNEVSRSFLASFILVMDLLIVMQVSEQIGFLSGFWISIFLWPVSQKRSHFLPVSPSNELPRMLHISKDLCPISYTFSVFKQNFGVMSHRNTLSDTVYISTLLWTPLELFQFLLKSLKLRSYLSSFDLTSRLLVSFIDIFWPRYVTMKLHVYC